MSRFVRMRGCARSATRLNVERLEERVVLNGASVGQIGINFVGEAPGLQGSAVTGVAGVVAQSNWNNAAGNLGMSTNLLDSDGAPTDASATWSANNSWLVAANRPGTGNAQLFKGYLDTTDMSTTSVTIGNVPYSLYDVIVYFDGGAAIGRNGIYGVISGLETRTQGPYFDRANWPIGGEGGEFQLADEPNEAGNYAVFRGLTGRDVTVTARATNPAAFRAPLNAVQIVGYPLSLVVNALGDVDDGDPKNGTTTLREAVNISNGTPGPAEIGFDLPAGIRQIVLAGSELVLSDDVKIVGPGIESLKINADGGSRVFRVTGGAKAELSGLWITGGNVQGAHLPPGAARYGGGILNDGSSLTVERSWINGNRAEYGGGIANFGHASGAARLVLRDTTISFNVAFEAGGLDNNGTAGTASASVLGSTIAYNEADSGAGIYNYKGQSPGSHASVEVTNSTISENSAREHFAGIMNYFGVATVVATTITENRADSDRNGSGGGGGIFTAASGTTTITRSIVADNLAARDADIGAFAGGVNTSLGQNVFHKGVPNIFPEHVFGATLHERRVFQVPIVEGGVTWAEANAAAVAAGGHLATIISQQEDDQIAYLTRAPNLWSGPWGPWIGGQQTGGGAEPAGGWQWVTGEPMTYHDWSPGEPNNSPDNEDRLHLMGGPGASGWNDIAGASTTPISYIIEYDALAYHNSDRIVADPRLLPLADNGGPTWTHALPHSWMAEFQRSYHDSVRRSAPASWWQLDDAGGFTAVDAAGDRHGATNGNMVLGQIGAPIVAESNLAADFDNGRIVVPYHAALNNPTFSVEIWVKPEATSGGPFTIVSTASVDATGNTSGYELSLREDGNFQLRLGTGTTSWSTQLLLTQGNFDWNGWNYIIAAYSAQSGPDANGVYLGSYSYQTENGGGGGGTLPFKPNTVEPLLIGAGNLGAPFVGKIDEVAIYDRNASGDANRDSRGRSEWYAQPWRITPIGVATQSSTWFDISAAGADRAVDGDLYTTSHTHQGDVDPHWQVNLGAPQPIGRIVLHNRRDCCTSRLRDITVEVLGATGEIVYHSAVLNPENVLGGGSVATGPSKLVVDLVVELGGPVIGQTIVVRRNSDPDLLGSGGQGNEDDPDVLSLAEVEVFLTAPNVDQRGVTRPRGQSSYGGVNSGSYEPTDSAVVGRHVFYNNSGFDGGSPVADGQDDSAIATDKQPLRGGESARFANFTSFPGGINGLMVDISDLPAPATAANWGDYFAFRVGNTDDPSSWATAPPPTAVTTRPGAGANGSDRITLVWQDGAIVNQWLEVAVKAGPATTGLAADDVFYFGNSIGETGNDRDGRSRVDFVDRTAINYHVGELGGVNHPFDVNRDGTIDATDVAVVEANYNGLTGDVNRDDVVGLGDFATIQTFLNTSLGELNQIDTDGDRDMDRADVARMVFSDPLHQFGAQATPEMLKSRLRLIAIPTASPLAAPADAVLASIDEPRRERDRLAATRSRARIGVAAADRAFEEERGTAGINPAAA